MGLALLILLIGIPIGTLMLVKPRQMWWATESWKYKNPNANEPSAAAYGMSAIGGLVIVAVSIGMAAMAWSTARDQKKLEDEQYQKAQWEQEVQAYQPPPPVDRGRLPIIGYRDDGPSSYQVYFLQPKGARWAALRDAGPSRRGWYQCLTRVNGTRPTDGGPTPLRAGLSWAPDIPQRDTSASDACTVDNLAANGEIGSQTVYGRSAAGLVTDSPIVDVNGIVLTPAGPTNPVPKLDTVPHR